MSAVGGKVSLLVARTERVHIYDAGAAHALIAFQYKAPGARERDFLRAFCGFARSQNVKNKNTETRSEQKWFTARHKGGVDCGSGNSWKRSWNFVTANSTPMFLARRNHVDKQELCVLGSSFAAKVAFEGLYIVIN